MKEVPEWLVNLAKGYQCPKCNSPINIDKIISLGVKESHKYKDREVIFFEYFCEDCKDLCIFELDFSDSSGIIPKMLDSLSEDIGDIEDIDNDEVGEEIEEALNEFYGNSSNKKKSKDVKSGISDSEFKNIKSFLSDCKYWEDFLGEIGLSPELIDKYSKVDNKE